MGYEPAHTLTLDGDSRLLRFYEWAYMVDKKSANFCKLFWAVALFALWAPIRILAVAPIHFIKDHWPDKPPATEMTDEDWNVYRVKLRARVARQAKWEAFWDKVTDKLAVVVSAVTALKPVFKGVGIALAAVVATLIGIQLIIAIIKYPLIALTSLGSVVLGLLVVIGGLFALQWIDVRYQNRKGRKDPDFFDKIAMVVTVPFKGFWHIMKLGYYYVKNNTCPQVVVHDNRTSNPR